MDSAGDAETPASRPPPKFSIFRNRPAWANTSHSDTVNTNDEDPFDRTSQTLAQLEAEEARKKEKKARRKAAKVAEEEAHRQGMTKRIRLSDVQDLLEIGDDDDGVKIPRCV